MRKSCSALTKKGKTKEIGDSKQWMNVIPYMYIGLENSTLANNNLGNRAHKY